MECPNCKNELNYHDWYGIGMKFDGSGTKSGEILKCENEVCESYEETFYTRKEELFEGYPC